jgi:protein gp37
MPYFIGKNITTHAMIQDMVDNGNAHFTVRTLKSTNAIEKITGGLQQSYSIGFGCVLIEREILELIPFRWESDGSVINNQISDAHSDSFFYADCFKKGVPVFLDTSQTVRHYNSKWLN